MNLKEFDIATENVIIPQDDLKINIDKWGPGNPLWITGASGDGKSTLAEKLSKENNAIIITSDVMLFRISKPKEKFENMMKNRNDNKCASMHKMNFASPVLDYIDSHPELPYDARDPETRALKNEITEPLMVNFYMWLMKELTTNPKYKNNLYIIEGCDICLLDAEIMRDKPLIIVGGSRLRSLYRRAKRDSDADNKPFIKELFKKIKKYNRFNRRLDDNKDAFRKSIETEVIKS